MAPPKTAKFSQWLVQLGDGGNPEVFVAPCGLTSRGLQLQQNANEQVLPDCADEDAPAWVAREVESLSGTVSGSGLLDTASLETWRDWFLSATTKNIRMNLNVPAADGGGYFAGAFLLTNLQVTGERGQKVAIEVEMQSAGQVTWTDAV